jgi:hypothetical protein
MTHNSMNSQRSPDDDWFDALGGQPTGAAPRDIASAQWVREQVLSSSAQAESPSDQHRRVQLEKLMVRLEQEGHFADRTVVASASQITPRRASSTAWWRMRAVWVALLLAVPAAILVWTPTEEHDLSRERGQPNAPVRLVDSPMEAATALCHSLKAFTSECASIVRDGRILVRGKMIASEAASKAAFDQEIVSSPDGEFVVEFKAR